MLLFLLTIWLPLTVRILNHWRGKCQSVVSCLVLRWSEFWRRNKMASLDNTSEYCSIFYCFVHFGHFCVTQININKLVLMDLIKVLCQYFRHCWSAKNTARVCVCVCIFPTIILALFGKKPHIALCWLICRWSTSRGSWFSSTTKPYSNY